MDFETKLDSYARLAVEIGVNLRAGQRLLVNAPIETAPIVQRIAEHAYRAGARLVSAVYTDEQLDLARFRHAPKDSFDEFPEWVASAWEGALEGGDAMISVLATDPDLLGGFDPDLVTRAMQARAKHLLKARSGLMHNEVAWSIVSVPIASWASRVFPNVLQDEALERLWNAIFRAVRADQPDPVAAWRAHLENLHARRDWLNAQRFESLHLTGGGTDLEVGLADAHVWASGQSLAQNGVLFCANMPTEEVFTAPHKDRVQGVVRSTKPFAYAGAVVDGIEVTFDSGRVVRARAARGEDVFLKLLDTDEGARRIGEIALVPHKNPVSDAGFLFFNTLFDENAASHIALGRAYPFTVDGGNGMDAARLASMGANSSLVHEDWMIGSDRIDVDGVKADGSRVPVMREGAWVF